MGVWPPGALVTGRSERCCWREEVRDRDWASSDCSDPMRSLMSLRLFLHSETSPWDSREPGLSARLEEDRSCPDLHPKIVELIT